MRIQIHRWHWHLLSFKLKAHGFCTLLITFDVSHAFDKPKENVAITSHIWGGLILPKLPFGTKGKLSKIKRRSRRKERTLLDAERGRGVSSSGCGALRPSPAPPPHRDPGPSSAAGWETRGTRGCRLLSSSARDARPRAASDAPTAVSESPRSPRASGSTATCGAYTAVRGAGPGPGAVTWLLSSLRQDPDCASEACWGGGGEGSVWPSSQELEQQTESPRGREVFAARLLWAVPECPLSPVHRKLGHTVPCSSST